MATMLVQHNAGRSFGGGGENGLVALPPSQQSSQGNMSSQKSSIYTAIYSGVSVYEMEVNSIAVMRRRSDSWLNATQILKVAGIDKGKRTKVLEKEILVGEHEKVQGGYGKYQGTWINYQRSVEFCRQYGVEELLRPLLEYDMGQDGVSAAGSGGVETPTKEQAMAAQRKKLYNLGSDNRPMAPSANGTFFKNISSTASNAVAAISKARFDSPGPRQQSNGARRPGSIKRQSSSQQLLHTMASQDSSFPGGSQQSMHSLASETSFNGGPVGLDSHLDSTYGTQSASTNYYANNTSSGMHDLAPNGGGSDLHDGPPPRKRIRPSPSVDHLHRPSRDASFSYDTSMRDGSPTAATDMDDASFAYPTNSQHSGTHRPRRQSLAHHDDNNTSHPHHHHHMALPPLPAPSGKLGDQKLQLLLSLFVDQSRTDYSRHEALLHLSGADLDLPLDATEHTALHWAATLACMPLLKALIARGASIYRVNGGGETALIRACVVTNNLDQGSFPELLEMLGPTIEMRDGRGRTVLHHIAVSSAVKGRSGASRYYLESLLEFVVRQGSAPSSQQNSFQSGSSREQQKPSIGLGRFMSEIVNAQDNAGDTALNAAARIGNRSIIQQLLEVGADASIPNRSGLKPSDFGVGIPPTAVVGGGSQDTAGVGADGDGAATTEKAMSKAVGETSLEILNSISTLLTSTSTAHLASLSTLQTQITTTHSSLRTTSSSLAHHQSLLDSLNAQAAARQKRRERIANLRSLAHTSLPNGDNTSSTDAAAAAEASSTVSIDEELIPAVTTPASDTHTSVSGELRPETRTQLARAPEAATLEARLRAYQANNARLALQSQTLSRHSSELEGTYRRVVSLCTGVGEEEVEKVLGGLVVAVTGGGGAGAGANAGEGGQDGGGVGLGVGISGVMGAGMGVGVGGGEGDVGRLRAFLQRVEGV